MCLIDKRFLWVLIMIFLNKKDLIKNFILFYFLSIYLIKCSFILIYKIEIFLINKV